MSTVHRDCSFENCFMVDIVGRFSLVHSNLILKPQIILDHF